MFLLSAAIVAASHFTIEPLRPPDKRLGFGAIVRGLDLENGAPSDDDIAQLESALATHGLLLLESAAAPDLEPREFANLVKRLNPGSKTIWRDQDSNPWELHKAENMGPAGTFNIPDCRDVLVVGKGDLNNHFGLSCTLGGKRAAYGKTSGSQVIGGGALQWHLDGAFWDAPSSPASGLPCRVVGMRCVEAPAPPRTFDVDYGDGATLTCTTGATAFCSGAVAYDLLTEDEKEEALRTTVVYAAHPFKRFAKLGMTKDGLRCVGGPEVESHIEESERDGALRLPLVWRHPLTGRPALMPHTRCLESIEIASADGVAPIVLDTDEARSHLHKLMRRAVDPDLVWPLAWRAGDAAVWDNRAVWHSATGGLSDDERRVMHLVAYDGTEPPTAAHAEPPMGTLRGGQSEAADVDVLGLIIGQTPRDDLLVPLRETLEGAAESFALTARGALDGVADHSAPLLDYKPQEADATVDASDCPLITRLTTGTPVTVRESDLTPLLQAQLNSHVGALAVTAGRPCIAVLLCAGRFDGLRAPVGATTTLLRPFEIAAAMASHLGVRSALLCVPTEAQRPYAIARWRKRLPHDATLATFVLPEEPDEGTLRELADAARTLVPYDAAIILDFVGHPEAIARRLRELAPGRVVIDVGGAALSALQGMLRSRAPD